MATDRFILMALPHSCGDDADFHVSLFVAPNLLPDPPDGEEPLGNFPQFRRWAQVVKDGAPIELSDDNGVIDCTPILDVIEPEVWDAAFPPDTPVRGRDLPKLADRHW